VLSTVHFECSADARLVAASGTLANLIFGGLFLAAACRQTVGHLAAAKLLPFLCRSNPRGPVSMIPLGESNAIRNRWFGEGALTWWAVAVPHDSKKEQQSSHSPKPLYGGSGLVDHSSRSVLTPHRSRFGLLNLMSKSRRDLQQKLADRTGLSHFVHVYQEQAKTIKLVVRHGDASSPIAAECSIVCSAVGNLFLFLCWKTFYFVVEIVNKCPPGAATSNLPFCTAGLQRLHQANGIQ
jgi:hypothetical protein